MSQYVAIITGASSGIGAAVAEELDAMGMRLILTARRENRLAELAGKLHAATVLAGDIAERTVAQKVLDLALEKYGRCDLVFDNAGVLLGGSPQGAVQHQESSSTRRCGQVRRLSDRAGGSCSFAQDDDPTGGESNLGKEPKQ